RSTPASPTHTALSGWSTSFAFRAARRAARSNSRSAASNPTFTGLEGPETDRASTWPRASANHAVVRVPPPSMPRMQEHGSLLMVLVIPGRAVSQNCRLLPDDSKMHFDFPSAIDNRQYFYRPAFCLRVVNRFSSVLTKAVRAYIHALGRSCPPG